MRCQNHQPKFKKGRYATLYLLVKKNIKMSCCVVNSEKKGTEEPLELIIKNENGSHFTEKDELTNKMK